MNVIHKSPLFCIRTLSRGGVKGSSKLLSSIKDKEVFITE